MCKFIPCDHYWTPLPRPKSLNKMSDLFKNVFWYIIREISNEKILPGWCAFFLLPDRFKTHEMCDEAVACSPRMLRHVPGYFKTQEMCDKATGKNPHGLQDVPDHFKAQEMCEKAVEKASWVLKIVPD